MHVAMNSGLRETSDLKVGQVLIAAVHGSIAGLSPLCSHGQGEPWHHFWSDKTSARGDSHFL